MVIVAALLARRVGTERLLTKVERERYPTVNQLLREVYAGPKPTPRRQHTGGKA